MKKLLSFLRLSPHFPVTAKGLSDFNLDSLPAMAIGKLHTCAEKEAATMVRKIITAKSRLIENANQE
ncbi:MAG TPA: hypothetical protein VF762_24920 [Blastocatellia bacterium]